MLDWRVLIRSYYMYTVQVLLYQEFSYNLTPLSHFDNFIDGNLRDLSHLKDSLMKKVLNWEDTWKDHGRSRNGSEMELWTTWYIYILASCINDPCYIYAYISIGYWTEMDEIKWSSMSLAGILDRTENGLKYIWGESTDDKVYSDGIIA